MDFQSIVLHLFTLNQDIYFPVNYFVREYKKAQIQFYDAKTFFGSCLNIISSLENNMHFQYYRGLECDYPENPSETYGGFAFSFDYRINGKSTMINFFVEDFIEVKNAINEAFKEVTNSNRKEPSDNPPVPLKQPPLSDNKMKIDFYDLVLNGFTDPVEKLHLSNYFFRKFKEAEKENYDATSFFGGCTYIIQNFEEEFNSLFQKRKGELTLWKTLAQTNQVSYEADPSKTYDQKRTESIDFYDSELKSISINDFSIMLRGKFSGHLWYKNLNSIKEAVEEAKKNVQQKCDSFYDEIDWNKKISKVKGPKLSDNPHFRFTEQLMKDHIFEIFIRSYYQEHSEIDEHDILLCLPFKRKAFITDKLEEINIDVKRLDTENLSSEFLKKPEHEKLDSAVAYWLDKFIRSTWQGVHDNPYYDYEYPEIIELGSEKGQEAFEKLKSENDFEYSPDGDIITRGSRIKTKNYIQFRETCPTIKLLFKYSELLVLLKRKKFLESELEKFEIPQTNKRKVDNRNENQLKIFPEYLMLNVTEEELKAKQIKLADMLKSEFKTEKGISIRCLLEALQQNNPKLMNIGYKQFKDVFTSMQIYFNRNIGSYNSVQNPEFKINKPPKNYNPIKLRLDNLLVRFNS